MKKEVLFFVNIIAPYNIPLFNLISKSFNGNIHFYFDQQSEANRSWQIDNNTLQFHYTIENSFNIKRKLEVGNKAILQQTLYFPFFVINRIFQNRPSIVVTIEFGLRTLLCIFASKLTGAKVLIMSDVTIDSESNVSPVKKLIRKIIFQLADGGIARSYKAKKYLETLKREGATISVAPYAVNNSLDKKEKTFNKLDHLISNIKHSENEKFCFLYSGQFSTRKGLDLLIDVVESLPDYIQNRMIIIMAGGTHDDLSKINNDYNRNIFYPIGFIQNDELMHYYEKADCFLLPTRADTWALVVNEAIVADCPVMVSKYAGSADELIENNVNGVVFDPLDKIDFSYKLTMCIENREILKSFSLKAQEKLTEYNYGVAAKRIIDLLKLKMQ